MTLLFLILWGGLVLTAFLAPGITLFFYGILASDRDSLGISSFLNLLLSENKLMMRAIFLLSFVVACIHILSYLVQKIRGNLNVHFLIAFLASLLVILVSLMKGYDIVSSLSILVYLGLPVFLIWSTTQSNVKYRKLFYVYIFVQINIATCVLLFPSLSFIDGGTYQTLEGLSFSSAEDGINTELPDFSSNKGDYVRFGHFHNPNALGFYAGASLILGFYFLFKRKNFITLFVSSNLLICGLICWLNSLTRGPMLAVLVYLAISFFYSSLKQGKVRFTALQLMLTFMVAFFLVIALVLNLDILLYLIPDSDNSSVSWRVEGYINGLNAIIANPLLGVGPTWEWIPGLNPHLLPITVTSDFGILVGFILTFLLFVLAPFACVKAYLNVLSQRMRKDESALCIGLILLILSIGLTNNIAATVLFWLCLAESLIRIYQFRK